MSYKSLTSKHTCTLITHTHTQAAAGTGTGARITAPTRYYNNLCRIVEASARTQRDFGAMGMEVDYQVFFHYNPRSVTAGGAVKRIEFTDENGNTRVLKLQGEKNADQLDRQWRYDCLEITQNNQRE